MSPSYQTIPPANAPKDEQRSSTPVPMMQKVVIAAMMVGTALVAGYSYGASTNPVMIDKATMTTTTMTTAANLVRRGDAGQEDFSSTSVGDNSINSVTNSFGEGGGRHRGCVDYVGGGGCGRR